MDSNLIHVLNCVETLEVERDGINRAEVLRHIKNHAEAMGRDISELRSRVDKLRAGTAGFSVGDLVTSDSGDGVVVAITITKNVIEVMIEYDIDGDRDTFYFSNVVSNRLFHR